MTVLTESLGFQRNRDARRASMRGAVSYIVLALIAIGLAVPAAIATCASGGDLFVECYGPQCQSPSVNFAQAN